MGKHHGKHSLINGRKSVEKQQKKVAGKKTKKPDNPRVA
jgi:hypothetical protein